MFTALHYQHDETRPDQAALYITLFLWSLSVDLLQRCIDTTCIILLSPIGRSILSFIVFDLDPLFNFLFFCF